MNSIYRSSISLYSLYATTRLHHRYHLYHLYHRHHLHCIIFSRDLHGSNKYLRISPIHIPAMMNNISNVKKNCNTCIFFTLDTGICKILSIRHKKNVFVNNNVYMSCGGKYYNHIYMMWRNQ